MSLLSGFIGTGDRGLRGRPAAGMFDALEARQLLTGAPFAAGHTIVDLKTTYGDVWIELFDQETPLTVANFMNYVNNNRFDNTFIHRNATDFVLQMGGYTYNTITQVPDHIPTFAPVQNEFSATRSNLLRTVAMAKLGPTSPGGGPDSATSEFFFNLGDNSSNLDNQNGGFTVFGQVVNGWDVVLKITRLQTTNAGGAFDNLPVRENWSGGTVTDQNLVVISDVVTITNITWDQHGNGGRNVTGAATLGGQTLFSTVSPLGHAIAFYQSSATATWLVSDISLQTGTSAIAGQIITWADPKDNRFYVAAPTAGGLLLFTRDSDGFWKARNLKTEIPASDILPVSASLTVFISTGDATTKDIVTIGSLNAQGQLVLFTQSSKTATGGDYPWTFINLHTRDLVPHQQSTPAFVGPLVSYVTSWNAQNIAGLNAQGEIWIVWMSPLGTNGVWTANNLTGATGAPAVAGGLTPYLSSWGGTNLAATDASGKVQVLWWTPLLPDGNPRLDWSSNDLTTPLNGLPIVPASLTSFVYPWDGSNIVGLDTTGKLVVYWWSPLLADGSPNLSWSIAPLSALVTGAVPPVGAIFSVAAPTGRGNIAGLSANGDVLRYTWAPGEAGWTMENLTTVAAFW